MQKYWCFLGNVIWNITLCGNEVIIIKCTYTMKKVYWSENIVKTRSMHCPNSTKLCLINYTNDGLRVHCIITATLFLWLLQVIKDYQCFNIVQPMFNHILWYCVVPMHGRLCAHGKFKCTLRREKEDHAILKGKGRLCNFEEEWARSNWSIFVLNEIFIE